MDNTLRSEDVFIQIRDKLQKDGIKLWLPPYFEEKTGASNKDIEALSQSYSKTLNIDYDLCFRAVSELLTNAVEKLKQRDRFKESGYATVKVKILNDGVPKLITKEILLSMTGDDFRALIAEESSLQMHRFKLICNGTIIKEDIPLSQQGVKNGNQFLCLVLNQSVTVMQEQEQQQKDIEATKADTSLLAADNSYMHLEDQHGNVIQIPAHEKQALMVAIALHEKGRSALKREDYARALVFFLDADRGFSQCNSQILQTVDNYALLDLDIAWCYLCLQSFVQLPEAYQRLKRCEEMFHKSYGQNLERLIALKGSSSNESALFMRLHLMQAIVLYHQNKRPEALALLEKCQGELAPLKVDEGSLMALVELGFSEAEGRIGLRATNGDVNQAANYINENRNKRIEARKKALAEKILLNEKKKLGRCVDGKQYVDPRFLNMLVNMGYPKETARRALQHTNNVISDSIQYIQEHPEPGSSNTKSQEFLSLLEDLIPELTAAGFDTKMARLALRKNNGDIMKAAEELLQCNGIIEGIEDYLSDFELEGLKENLESAKKKEEAWSRLSQDISMVDDDHLDLSLEKEEEFLNQYLSLLMQ
ncbi:NEDD8 ultimate buster 1-like [Atheta coriaria]|uniref:NEDD8 ultimate buster 1-like n=1 Tax=Dalotia coriaria TaxID=877792 RepID=UPI0031F45B68